MTATDIKDKAHQFLIDKGCKSMTQMYSAFTVEKMLVEFAVDEMLSIERKYTNYAEVDFLNDVKNEINKL